MGKTVSTLELRLSIELDSRGKPSAWYMIGYGPDRTNDYWDDDSASYPVRRADVEAAVRTWLHDRVWCRQMALEF